ncbi:MAG: hypothetical protein D6820_08220, partial [Lentisphaerae bacterium]
MDELERVIEFLQKNQAKLHVRTAPNLAANDFARLIDPEYLKWLQNQKFNPPPRKLRLEIHDLEPSKYGCFEIKGMENYGTAAFLYAKLDSSQLLISTDNISEFTISTKCL